MLKVLMSLFFVGSAGASYFGFSGGDQTLGYAGLIIAAVFFVVLFFMFMKAIGCMVTVIVIVALLFAIAYFGGFVKLPWDKSCPDGKCEKVVSSDENVGFWTKILNFGKDGKKNEEPAFIQYTVSGVPSVIDGNTIRVDGVKLHLYGVEAPRMAQPCQDRFGRDYYCGAVSVEKLASMLGKNPVSCTVIGEKKGETYGVCTSGEDDIGAYMIGLGYAFPHPEYGTVYFTYENNARTKGLGLWDGTKFSAPWEWDVKQAKASEKGSSGGSVVVPAAKKKSEEKGLLWKNFFE